MPSSFPRPAVWRSARLPIGLASHVKLLRGVAAGEFVKASDVALDEHSQAVRVRRQMQREAQPPTDRAATDHRAAATARL